MHAFFDGEVIFARDVIHVNMDLSPFPVDFQNLWDWFREQLRGGLNHETFAYELSFAVDADEDPVMQKLIEITKGSGKTIWDDRLDASGNSRRWTPLCNRDCSRQKARKVI